MVSSPPPKDWLLADDSYLPTNQLPLLRSMIGMRLINIQRFIFASPDAYEFQIKHQDFFRQGHGPLMFELEGIPPIYLKKSYTYHWDEKSIDVSLEPPGRGIVKDSSGTYFCYSLQDKGEYIDEQLYQCIGQHLLKLRILVRQAEFSKDVPRALQAGIEMSFDGGTVIIVSYYLNKATTRTLQLLYPTEIQWNAVKHAIDVEKGRIPWQYRFNRWWWRALDRFGRRFGL